MSNRDSRLTKRQNSPQFVTPICQIIGFQGQSEVTAICQIMTVKWQVVTLVCQTQIDVVACSINMEVVVLLVSLIDHRTCGHPGYKLNHLQTID